MPPKKAQAKKPTKSSARKSKPKATRNAEAKKASLLEEQVQTLVEKMKPELQEKLDKIRRALTNTHASEIANKCVVGRIVKNVAGAPRKYGKRAVGSLAKALGVDKSTLYDYAKVAGAWSNDELGELRERSTAKGLPLSFSHLLLIAEQEDKDTRDEWVEKVFAEALSVRQLRKLLNPREATANEDEASEQPVKAPWVKGLEALTASTQDMLQRVRQLDVDKALAAIPLGETSPQEQSLIESTLKIQQELELHIKVSIERLRAALATKANDEISRVASLPPVAETAPDSEEEGQVKAEAS